MAKKTKKDSEVITNCDNLNNVQPFEMQNLHLNDIDIKSLIYVIRGQQVMLDSDLAMLYGVETRSLNQAVKRNIGLCAVTKMQILPETILQMLNSSFNLN